MRIFYHFGRYLKTLRYVLARPESFRMYLKEVIRQMYDIGVGSLGLVAIIAFFIGAVMAVQTAFQLVGSFIPQYYVGFIVRDSVLLEMAPTLTALVLAGKVGSNIASEIGTMRISEQIDALEIMGVNTISFLMGPRLIAALIMIPMLVIFSAALGMFGGWAAVWFSGSLDTASYEKGLMIFYDPFYVNIMLVKSVVFGFILTSIACYQGFYAHGGALEIGKASTRAVVMASIMILVADFIIAILMT